MCMGSSLRQAQIPADNMASRSLWLSGIMFLSWDQMRSALRRVLTQSSERNSIMSDLRQDLSRGWRLMCDSGHPYLDLNIASGFHTWVYKGVPGIPRCSWLLAPRAAPPPLQPPHQASGSPVGECTYLLPGLLRPLFHNTNRHCQPTSSLASDPCGCSVSLQMVLRGAREGIDIACTNESVVLTVPAPWFLQVEVYEQQLTFQECSDCSLKSDWKMYCSMLTL